MEEHWRAKKGSSGRDGAKLGCNSISRLYRRGPFQAIRQLITAKQGLLVICWAGMVEQILDTLCGPDWLSHRRWGGSLPAGHILEGQRSQLSLSAATEAQHPQKGPKSGPGSQH